MFVDARLTASRLPNIPFTEFDPPSAQVAHRFHDDVALDEFRTRLIANLDQAVMNVLQRAGSRDHKRRAVQARLGSRPLSSFPSAALLSEGRRKLRSLFERPEPLRADDLDAVAVLADVLRRLDADDWGDFDEVAQVKVAFYGSVNPVEFVPGAFALGETCAVACWLGDLARCAPVSMPAFAGAYWSALLDGHNGWPPCAWAPDAFLVEQAARFMSPAVLRTWIKETRTKSLVAKRQKNALAIFGLDGANLPREAIVSSPSYC